MVSCSKETMSAIVRPLYNAAKNRRDSCESALTVLATLAMMTLRLLVKELRNWVKVLGIRDFIIVLDGSRIKTFFRVTKNVISFDLSCTITESLEQVTVKLASFVWGITPSYLVFFRLVVCRLLPTCFFRFRFEQTLFGAIDFAYFVTRNLGILENNRDTHFWRIQEFSLNI